MRTQPLMGCPLSVAIGAGEADERPACRDIELPADEHQRVALLQQPRVAELVFLREVGGTFRPTEHAQQALPCYRGSLRRRARRWPSSRRLGFQHPDIRGEGDAPSRVARRLVDVHDDPVVRIGGIDGETQSCRSTLREANAPERNGHREHARLPNLHARDLCLRHQSAL